jgi:hypothetical protein
VSTAVIATQLTDRAVRYKRLNIGGTDYLNDYFVGGTQYGIARESISLTEEGPDGVSSLAFSIWDPLVQVVIASNDWVEFWDITRDRPLFSGFLQSFEVEPVGPSRWVHVECVGIEVLLDWMVVPALTIPTGTEIAAAFQSCVANATGVGWLIRAGSSPDTARVPYSTQALPVASVPNASLQSDIVLEGESLRNALEKCGGAAETSAITYQATAISGFLFTIDFYSGLRAIPTYDSSGVNVPYPPTDYATLAFTDTLAGTYATHDLSIKVEASGVVHAVYVKGANAAGSGLVSDGSGLPGPVSFISDDTSNTADKRNIIAGDYLYTFAEQFRGSATLAPITTAQQAGNYHPGGLVSFGIDAQVFGTAASFTIMSIRKTFVGGDRENWVIAFGGYAPSAVKQIRRLTRDTRN